MAAKLEQLIIRYNEFISQIKKPGGIFETLSSVSDKARDYLSDPRNFKYSAREWAIYWSSDCQIHREEKKYYREFAMPAILIYPRAAS